MDQWSVVAEGRRRRRGVRVGVYRQLGASRQPICAAESSNERTLSRTLKKVKKEAEGTFNFAESASFPRRSRPRSRLPACTAAAAAVQLSLQSARPSGSCAFQFLFFANLQTIKAFSPQISAKVAPDSPEGSGGGRRWRRGGLVETGTLQVFSLRKPSNFFLTSSKLSFNSFLFLFTSFSTFQPRKRPRSPP